MSRDARYIRELRRERPEITLSRMCDSFVRNNVDDIVMTQSRENGSGNTSGQADKRALSRQL